MQLLAAVLKDRSVATLREIDPDMHLLPDRNNPERRAIDYIRQHHDEYRVLPTARVLAQNTGIVLPEVDQPAAYYFRRIRQRAMHNQIREPYSRLLDAMQSPRTSSDELSEAIDEMYRLKCRLLDAGTGLETSDALIDQAVAELASRRMTGAMLRGITTGYGELDATMDGYQNGDLVVWVGRPGRAKSWFLLKQAHAAWMAGWKPLYISMEMGGVQNMRRLIGIHSGINPTFIKRGQIGSLSMPHFNEKVQELLDLRPMHMVTANFSRTVDQIANFVDQYSPDVVYIDAGYLLSPRKKRYGSSGRRETISDVVEELKELAGNTNRPVVITVQFNRQAEHRRRSGGASFDPLAHLSLAEIGETDVIGQAASHVLGIEYAPPPLPRNAYRTFGFLKGREGETGWWLTNFIQHQFSPVNLDLVPRSDPVYDIVRRHAEENGGGRRNAREVNPEHRTALMRVNPQ